MKINENNNLLCCKCDSEYLHHYKVEVFDRREDRPKTHKTTVFVADQQTDRGEECGTLTRELSEEAHGRRGHVVINFWCENCGEEHGLVVWQHKGTSIIGWK